MNVDVYKCAYDWSPNVCVFMPVLPKDMTVNDPSAFTQLCFIVSWVQKTLWILQHEWIFNLQGINGWKVSMASLEAKDVSCCAEHSALIYSSRIPL